MDCMSERVRIEPAPHIRVALGDFVVADTTHGYVVFEQGLPPRYYVPRADVKAELAPGTGAGSCPWKGEWKHLDVIAGEAANNLVGVPPAQRDDFAAPVTEVSGDELATAVACCGPVLAQSGPLDVLRVFIDALRRHPPSPGSQNHEPNNIQEHVPASSRRRTSR